MRGLTKSRDEAAGALDLARIVGERLDQRLLHGIDRPVAVAFSGGGDSLALLVAAREWAARRGRPLLALTVDHRLQPASADWTTFCAGVAARLGVGFRALAWEGQKPVVGLPAAARQARHRLLAEAARDADARVILMGHTASDRAEARAMRLAGSTTPSPREWSPSPAWPEGRGVFLARPLLACSRQEIRDWLRRRGESWIDDPANEDLRFARARARASGASASSVSAAPPDLRDLALACREIEGGLCIGREALRLAREIQAERFVSIACLCASGQSRPPRSKRAARLAAALRGRAALSATLAGARIEADAEAVRFLREPGRKGLDTIPLPPGRTVVWDGRFALRADREGLNVGPLAGRLRDLGRPQAEALRSAPPAARPCLPAVFDAEAVFYPSLDTVAGVEVLPLAGARLLAACGVVEREPA